MIAEEALKLAPASTWASHARARLPLRQGRLERRADHPRQQSCVRADRQGDLPAPARRAADGARAGAGKGRPRPVARKRRWKRSSWRRRWCRPRCWPASIESEAHQVRRSMRIVETAWLAQPHPDLADAYAHVKLGDSARQRLVRIETLAAKTPGHIEGALAIARAAIDAAEFERAREALAPFIAVPTQRVALLMAEIERTEHGDSGRARAWTLRAVRALHDPAWTADGYVSDRWRPVSPVSGRLDAFQWQTPVAACLPTGAPRSNPRRSRRRCWPRRRRTGRGASQEVWSSRSARRCRNRRPRRSTGSRPSWPPPRRTIRRRQRRRRAGSAAAPEPRTAASRTGAGGGSAPVPRPPGHSQDRRRRAFPPVIPIVRAPDDPGIDDEPAGGRIFGTNRPATGPGRRLARIFVPLGQLIRAGQGQRFSCQTGRCPISGAQRFQAIAERAQRWSAAIAQLVEHVIRNDGVTGSSPVCGTIQHTEIVRLLLRRYAEAKSKSERMEPPRNHTRVFRSFVRLRLLLKQARPVSDQKSTNGQTGLCEPPYTVPSPLGC